MGWDKRKVNLVLIHCWQMGVRVLFIRQALIHMRAFFIGTGQGGSLVHWTLWKDCVALLRNGKKFFNGIR